MELVQRMVNYKIHHGPNLRSGSVFVSLAESIHRLQWSLLAGLNKGPIQRQDETQNKGHKRQL